jgi:adenosylhomocysteine nucleosidase
MEGAAVAQVCKDFGMSFSVVRTISDAANDDAEHDFSNFLSLVASRYSATIMRFYLALIAQTY